MDVGTTLELVAVYGAIFGGAWVSVELGDAIYDALTGGDDDDDGDGDGDLIPVEA